MSESSDKSEIRRTVAFSEELWAAIGRFARERPPMTRIQAIKFLLARGLHSEAFDARKYLSTTIFEDE